MRRYIAILLMAMMVALVLAAQPAFAGETTDPDVKCNSGRGNLSETTPGNDCDPGRSFNNKGGD